MNQIGLAITPRLSYRESNFILHAGVKNCVENLINTLLGKISSSTFIEGKSRSGKTHFAVYLAERVSKLGLYPQVIEGAEFQNWITLKLNSEKISSIDLFIIDNAEEYFFEENMRNADLGESGGYVAFSEVLKRQGAQIVFLSSVPISTFPCDPHVMSRVRSSILYHIESPNEEDMNSLIRSLAEQRGVRLSERKLSFLIKRLPRDISRIEDYFDRLRRVTESRNEKMNFSVLADAAPE